MLNKSAIPLILAAFSTAAFGQIANPSPTTAKTGAYLNDGQHAVVRSDFGLCWRTGYWTADDAAAGCDGALVPPIAKPTAPPLVAPATAQAPAAPKRCDFTVTLGNEQAFASNRAVLTAAAKKRIDEEVASRLTQCASIDSVLVTGHADRLGSQQYNQKLSERRATAVASYLKDRVPAADISVLGMGKTQSITACNDSLPRAKFVACLAPDRRVVIEIRGKTQP